MPESYAGITVPEGEPEGLRTAASQLTGLAASLEGTGGELQSMPSGIPTWQGPASVAYAGTCMTQASTAQQAAIAMEHAALAARTYAEQLQDAQKDAREAIEDARDARRRIREAREDI